jgi:hypothetical protein
MSYYFLVASLKTLQIGDEPPFSTEEYINTCTQWITPRQEQILRKVLLNEQHISPCPLCESWNDIEVQIRNASAKRRAQDQGKDASPYLKPHHGFKGAIEQLVSDAFSHEDPVELEQELDRGRWQLAEELIDGNPFGFEKLLAYGIQLRITERWYRLDVHEGKQKLEAIITANTERGEAGNGSQA